MTTAIRYTNATSTTPTSDIVWCTWTNNTSSSTTAATWELWTSNSITTSATWTNWATTGWISNYQAPAWPAPRERQEAQQRRAAERALAHRRAKALLQSLLTPFQKAQLEHHGWFVVAAQSGRLYRIRNTDQINVDRVDAQGNVEETFCAYVGGGVPHEDTLAGQKLMLEHDEEAFLRLANVYSAYSREPIPEEEWQRSVEQLSARAG